MIVALIIHYHIPGESHKRPSALYKPSCTLCLRAFEKTYDMLLFISEFLDMKDVNTFKFKFCFNIVISLLNVIRQNCTYSSKTNVKMSFKGCLYLKPSIVPTILHRQNVHLNNFLPRRYKCRSAKRVQQYITTSNNPQLSSTQSISSRNVICSHRYMTTSQIVPDCSSPNNATIPKYSKDSLDPTTYDHYFHDYKCYPNFTWYV